MASYLLTPGHVRALILQYLLPPGLLVNTCYDATCNGVLGVIHDGYPLGLRCEFRLMPEDLILSSNALLVRLRERLQTQIDVLAPQRVAEPFDFDATG